METRARYVVIGAFVLAVTVAVFAFVYWMHSVGGIGQRANFRIRFEQPVAGLTSGSPVLFNGIRVGEVTGLRIEAERPRGLLATIGVESSTPIRADTAVDIDYQGLTGVAAVALRGGSADAPRLVPRNGEAPILAVSADVGKNLTQAARETLKHIDDILIENAKPLKATIAGLSTFADMLARNSERIEGVIAGLEKLTGGGDAKRQPAIYDLAAATSFPSFDKALTAQLAVPDPTAVLIFDSQKVLIRTETGTFSSVDNVQWADNLPKLMQARIVQSFSNARQLKTVSRPMDDLTADYRLAVEIRSFEFLPGPEPKAVVEFAARLLGDGGKVVDARLFKAAVPAKSVQPPDVMIALNAAFAQTAKDLVVWTVGAL